MFFLKQWLEKPIDNTLIANNLKHKLLIIYWWENKKLLKANKRLWEGCALYINREYKVVTRYIESFVIINMIKTLIWLLSIFLFLNLNIVYWFCSKKVIFNLIK